ncbi:phage scaffolding protein [Deinococcus radiodurans]|jgi:hypothetical protein|uniref:phage scaffolding protein n=1 Tax=Deinococcus radiodurans TaxID=1299 RepID=UPI000488F075|nr:hypothetical protein [Deinococcus radiodurans]ANC72957.1 hypothetical protein A2G07_13975 [Deinococcus radiodurans R1 = ATCC 13939 = DSM 20539]QEM72915.1 hypothetical protein DXG80_13955 [Deinococcus radiodurans]QIP30404.1 hypothetical protein HAV23_14220 [Deinococcus radiodurans]UDL01876.1 hypothetical protein E5E91_14180 [Deinococcus radiodurans R1 = ATCC 13939 = DSM 20539]UID71686.1 hypothetical protein DRO_A0097 [Deinococcus radiodurans R1 = ATCC 13939 = DSM 20539]
MTAPENTTPPPAPAPSNAPAFQPTETLALARENARLAAELQTVTTERDQLKGQVTDLEVKVNSSKEAELQQQLDAMKAENETLKTKVSTFEERDTTAERTKLLDGKVSDVQLALRVLDPEKHLNADGTLKTDALYTDFPSLAPAGITTPTAPDGGGGSQRTAAGATSLDRAVQGGSLADINAAFDAALTPAK